MDHINQRRKELKLSQAQLAAPCNVGRQCISGIESGLYLPSPELAAALQRELKTKGLSDSSQLLTPRDIRQLVTLRPFELPPVDRESWQRMHKAYPKLVRALNLARQTSLWIERNLPAECAAEGIGLFSLATKGAKEIWASPSQLGYRGNSLLDSRGDALGERLLPGLRWVENDFDAILWPQPRLLGAHGTFRPDGLILVKVNAGVFWRGMEVDGPVHRTAERSTWDRERERLLGLDLIRIPLEAVLRLEMPRLLASAFLALGSSVGRVA
ncbi:MAG: helix-turn-helix transcriptional regulator [Candidatus Eremiobacteraeota bacterium]|nr:helix-turn-helix transcriptional regulator [Candidatus Eremiobacteraeota bacterium]MCW5872195.1 helix-turn-helix transcriptional regulator [Candidatus Eremiobacteraeota bacterium]